jgi:hypothetical protein
VGFSVEHVAEPRGGFAATQIVIAVGWSLLLTDLFFLNVTAIPFTGVKSNSATNFALLLIPYLGFFPAVVMFTVALEPIIEASVVHLAITVCLATAAHLVLRAMHSSRMAEHVSSIDADALLEPVRIRRCGRRRSTRDRVLQSQIRASCTSEFSPTVLPGNP